MCLLIGLRDILIGLERDSSCNNESVDGTGRRIKSKSLVRRLGGLLSAMIGRI